MLKTIILIKITLLLTLYLVNKEYVLQKLNSVIYEKFKASIEYKTFDTNYINANYLKDVIVSYKNNNLALVSKLNYNFNTNGISLYLKDIQSDLTFVLPQELQTLNSLKLEIEYFDYKNINITLNGSIVCQYELSQNNLICNKYNKKLNILLQGMSY